MNDFPLYFLKQLVSYFIIDHGDRTAGEFDPDFWGDFHGDRMVGQTGDFAVEPAAGDDSVALFNAGQHFTLLFGFFLLGTDQQEVKNSDKRYREKE